MQTSGKKVEKWSQGAGELAEACKKVMDAAQQG